MKTLIIGLGNPILGDDGVGWRVVEQVEKRITKMSLPIEVDYLSLGGLSLMERLIGYERAIIVDAIYSGKNPFGNVTSFALDELPNPNDGHTTSAHDTTLITAMDAGKRLSVPLPETVQVVAIEAYNVHVFSEELSPPVAAAVPVATQKVIELLEE
jgi:hydrogenase maturation protease